LIEWLCMITFFPLASPLMVPLIRFFPLNARGCSRTPDAQRCSLCPSFLSLSSFVIRQPLSPQHAPGPMIPSVLMYFPASHSPPRYCRLISPTGLASNPRFPVLVPGARVPQISSFDLRSLRIWELPNVETFDSFLVSSSVFQRFFPQH